MSEIHAIATARRYGLEVSQDSVTLADESEPSNPHLLMASFEPLNCEACDYTLNDIIVTNSIVECPECGFPQVVQTATNRTRAHRFDLWIPKSPAQLLYATFGLLVLATVYVLARLLLALL